MTVQNQTQRGKTEAKNQNLKTLLSKGKTLKPKEIRTQTTASDLLFGSATLFCGVGGEIAKRMLRAGNRKQEE